MAYSDPRVQRLIKSYANRTTLSSRQRVLNQITGAGSGKNPAPPTGGRPFLEDGKNPIPSPTPDASTVKQPGAGSIYAPPAVNKTANAGQVYNAATAYAKAHGLNVSQGSGGFKSGLGASAGDVGRQKQLLSGLSRRTTESSRKRLLNRVLSASNVKASY